MMVKFIIVGKLSVCIDVIIYVFILGQVKMVLVSIVLYNKLFSVKFNMVIDGINVLGSV